MSDAVVAPENLTAWQRWEAPNLDSRLRTGGVELPTASQIEDIQRQAREEGFQIGHAEGVQKCHAGKPASGRPDRRAGNESG